VARLENIPSLHIRAGFLKVGCGDILTRYDLRFRRALSLAVNRREINDAIFFGQAIEGQNTVLRQSQLYEPQYLSDWASFDPQEANRLLDLIGFTKRDWADIRLLPDGSPMDVVVESPGKSAELVSILEFIQKTWRRIGVRLFYRPLPLAFFQRRVLSGATLMSIDGGIQNVVASAITSPSEFAPTSQQQLGWPKWGQYYETKGKAGEAPDLPSVVKLRDLYQQWLGTASKEQQADIWHQMLKIWAHEVFSIGIVAEIRR
jgi:peptide/nickel transport system substrate-binding protein